MNSISSPRDGNDKGKRLSKRTVDRLLNDTSPDTRSDGPNLRQYTKLCERRNLLKMRKSNVLQPGWIMT